MIDIDRMRSVIVSGLKKYLGITIIRANQTGDIPAHPYLSYAITTVQSQNNGTWGSYDDGIDRKPMTMSWSVTVQSDNAGESMRLAVKAKDWLDHVGRVYLSDNGVIVQKTTSVLSRDNMLTIEYEYRNGFDVTFWLLNEVESPTEETGWIETVEVGETTITVDNPAERLEARLDGDL